MKEKPPVIYGSGKQVRSYTYVSDIAKATILAAFNPNTDNEILNIGNGEKPINLNDLAETVIKVANKEGQIKPVFESFENSDRSQEREVIARYCDSSKARQLLNWAPEVSLEEGVKKVIEKGIIFERWENLYDEQN
jgi:nucleoside-diphosphate-sugar epimerase